VTRAGTQPPRLRFIASGDLSLALESRGVGARHLLFAHGWISSRRMFDDVVARLDLERYTTHALDFRGAGRSDRPPDGYDLAGYGSDLRAALAAIGAPTTVVAHSMGAKIAQFVALEPPPNLVGLVLVTPRTSRAVRENATHRASAERAFGSRARIERFQRAAMVREIEPEVMERLVDDALVASRDAWFGWYERGRAEDFFDRVGTIALPTVAIAGERDPLALPTRVRTDVADAIPGASFVTFKNVGHNIPVEMPTELAALIDRLPLDSYASSGTRSG
jgi:pimeloyl-ACP methyl ester carboxylesterase